MIKILTVPDIQSKYKFLVEYGGKSSWHYKIQNARMKALSILKEHPGYTVSIYKVDNVKEVPAGGFVKMTVRSISTLKFQ